MKKLPIIGLILGAIAAIFAFKGRKKDEPDAGSSGPDTGAP